MDEFRCDNGKCLPGPWQCNTVDECGDGSDEGNCSAPASEPPGSLCPGGTFPCSGARSTRCLPVERRCDGTQDCGDGSDEAGCPDLACGRRLGSFYGSFASPDLFGAARGPSDLHCTWLVDTQDQRRVLLQLELRLGYDDYVQVYEGLGERGDRLLQTLSYRSNHRPVSLEAAQGRLTVAYHARARSAGHGFNATYQVKGYCLPWEQPCGSSTEGVVDDTGEQGCFLESQRCDGWWHCASGRDEQGCPACPPDQYPCEGGSGLCYTPADRCNNQKSCPDGADEKNCFSCQPGTFHCGTNLCIFETWRCDGQEDCQDGSDEHGCLAAVPRKVITAALIGSLVCGLLLVIALGCAFKLYSLRTQEYRWVGSASLLLAVPGVTGQEFLHFSGERLWAHCSCSCECVNWGPGYPHGTYLVHPGPRHLRISRGSGRAPHAAVSPCTGPHGRWKCGILASPAMLPFCPLLSGPLRPR